jgi:hypothetical protein
MRCKLAYRSESSSSRRVKVGEPWRAGLRIRAKAIARGVGAASPWRTGSIAGVALLWPANICPKKKHSRRGIDQRTVQEMGQARAAPPAGPTEEGVIAESVPKRTLSGIEELKARISQRPKPILERLGWPDVVAIEADVFPSERGDVGEQGVGQGFALGAKLGDGVTEIDGVPEDDGGDREVETGGPVALVFEGAVADLAVAMEKQGPGQCVSGLAFIEPSVGTAPERRI